MPYFFEFRQDPYTQKWVISAPRRSSRPKLTTQSGSDCPFCPGNEKRNKVELLRLGSKSAADWDLRVIPNKFPFAPKHEIVIHHPNHFLNFFTFTQTDMIKIFKVYRERFKLHQQEGQVFIFHNHGEKAGESIPHSHTQIAVLPKNFHLEIPQLQMAENIIRSSKFFEVFCPCDSNWPYEVWFSPKKKGNLFSEITNDEIKDLSKQLKRVLVKLQKYLGKNFSFNFYIYPLTNWYLRLVPREKNLGGFEVGTGIFVNTVDPIALARKLA